MRITVAKNADKLLGQRHDRLLNDTKLDSSVRRMIGVHLIKPWIPRFWSVAIRPTGGGSESYLDFEVGRADETAWYFPSRKWWIAHAKASHPPDGTGCDVSVHVDFLTSEGATHEFDYATVTVDDRLAILTPDDFEKECRWWRSRKRGR